MSRFLAIVMILAAFLAGGNASAKESPAKLGIKPAGSDDAYFTLTLNPGDSKQLTVALTNLGPATMGARTYAADAYSLINGGFGVRLHDEPVEGTARWLEYPSETIDLESAATVTRTATLTVPSNTGPGEYIASLAIETAEPIPISDSGNAVVKQIVRQAIPVMITIPGERTPGLEIGDASYRLVADMPSVVFPVVNTGNVHLKPPGEFVLKDARGSEVSRLPITMGSVYAHDTTSAEIPLAQPLKPGQYTASLSLADSKESVQVSSGPRTFTVSDEQASTSQPVGSGSQRAPVKQATSAIPGWLLPALLGSVVTALVAAGVAFQLKRRE